MQPSTQGMADNPSPNSDYRAVLSSIRSIFLPPLSTRVLYTYGQCAVLKEPLWLEIQQPPTILHPERTPSIAGNDLNFRVTWQGGCHRECKLPKRNQEAVESISRLTTLGRLYAHFVCFPCSE